MCSPASTRNSARPSACPDGARVSQSTLIIGLLAGGFLLYLAANDRLSTYTNVLWGAAPTASSDSGGGGGGGSGGFPGNLLSTAAQVFPYVAAGA